MRHGMKRPLLFIWISLLLLLWMVGCTGTPLADQGAEATATFQPTVTATVQPTPTPTYTPVFEAGACRFPHSKKEAIRCGTLSVPEDRADPAREIRLHVAIVSSRSPQPAPDPVIFLDGGPGFHTLENAEGMIGLMGDILEERDLILFDQRGLGYSEPSLNCPELEESMLANIEKPQESEEVLAAHLAATLACRARLVAEGIDLSAYDSAASAADVEDLRRALGYDAWNLLGVSYGSRLALTVMRDYGHTGAIRSVILDSVYPPQVNDYTDMAASAHRAFELLFNRCAENEQCHTAYPNLKTRFYQLVDDLIADPIVVSVSDGANRTRYRVPFDGNDLIGTVFSMLYNKDLIIYLPKMLAQLEDGSSAILARYLSENLHTSAYFSEGMGLSVQCVEEAPFTTMARFREKSAGLPSQLVQRYEKSLTNNLATCEAWQVAAADPVENEPIVSDIPTLILAGDYDPVTPPTHALETADFLSNAFYFEFEGVGHGVAGSSRCGMELITAFLNQPNEPPDARCLDDLFFGFVTW